MFYEPYTRQHERRETKMNFTVVNKDIQVGNINIVGVGASSVFLIGDTKTICLSSVFDTPPESLIIGPYVPLSPQA
ncbi:spore germination protein [Fredinandcohnia quinoae]|uniref:Spore germination protein n=1 Tax=Fredinandcohnia quinoae TaxID=2918902 RepID=A0AAW5E8W3_9BACI|nr:spore germination protein [Fredinandcohnia sp. SECRCQ15]